MGDDTEVIGGDINWDIDDADYESYSEREPSEWYTTGIVPEGMTFDAMGNMVPVGDPSAASADPSGQAQAYLNAIQSGKDVNFSGALKAFQNILNGKGSMGGMGQIAALGGIATLLNKLGGGLGQTGQGRRAWSNRPRDTQRLPRRYPQVHG